MIGSNLTKVTADATVHDGTAHLHFIYIKAGGTQTTVLVRNGTSNSDTIIFDEDVAASGSWTFGPFERGLTFSSGIYVDVDANTDFVIIGYTPG